MENKKGSNKQIQKIDLIKRYPFNGRSKYLIDKFSIIGFRPNQLHKILFQNDHNMKILKNNAKKLKQEDNLNSGYNSKSSFNSDFQKIPYSKIYLDESPSLLNEISSDINKELPDFNLIKSILFQNKISVYIKSEFIKKSLKKGRVTVNENLSFQKMKSFPGKYEEDINNKSFSKENEDNENNGTMNLLYSKQYNIVFSYNPQSGTDSKKSINGFAYVFYKEFNEKKEIDDIKFTFYVPVTFCIISEFPYFNSYYRLCKQIIQLFQSNKNEIPLEILIYNIINFSLSPINGEVILNIEPMNFPTEKIVVNSLKRAKEEKNKEQEKENLIHTIKEEEEEFDDNCENPFSIYINDLNDKKKEDEKDNNNNNNNNNNNKIESTILPLKTNINDSNNNDINKKYDLRKSEKIKKSNINSSPEIRKKKIYFIDNPRNTINIGVKSPKLFNLEDDFDNKGNVNQNLFNPHEDIKFPFLSGYPLIQYNLSKILLHKLSPQDVIIIFFYSFLEKDILFFSKYIEYLSLTINSYLNLNFPLNDEKYYFFNACVSYDNFINDNSPFVGSIFTTILGINSSYNAEYLKKTKLKEHLAVDLDKGIIYMNEDQNDKEKSMKNKVLFDYIKKICRKEIKDDKIILAREVKILFEKLEQYKNENTSIENKLSNNFMSMSSRNIIRINERNNGYNNFIDYDERGRNSIKNKNRNIQEGFYRLINYISLYFYQNLSLKSDDDKSDLNKIIINRKKKGLNTDDMNIIFHKDYVDNVYIKEEMYLLDELMETMKFESFVYGFVQSYNPIDLYKIPLTMAEEFISILSRKNSGIYLNINFFSLIDNIYKKNGVEKIYIDFNPFSVEYYKKLKKYFDREIYDENNDNNNLNKKKVKEKYLKIKIKETNEGKTIDKLKYSEFILDNNLLLKYILLLKNIKKEEYYRMFHLASTLEQSKIKSISIIDIENEVEKYTNNINLSTKRDICSSNIILLFILSIKSIKNYIDCQSFLSCLFHNFIISRKYYTLIMKLLYRLIMICIEKEDYHNANNYFFCYYSCINSLRNMKIVPNENLMNIISKFNQIDLNDLLEKKNNCKKIEESDKNLDEHMNNIVQMDKYIYVIYNYMKNSFIKEKNIIQKLDEIKGKQNLSWIVLNKEGIEKKIQPKIKFNNGAFQYECYIYSQDKILDDLNKQYEIYSKNLDENKLDNKILFEACLNIILFARNTNFFPDADDLFEVFKIIFNVYLFKIMNTKIENESNTEIKE